MKRTLLFLLTILMVKPIYSQDGATSNFYLGAETSIEQAQSRNLDDNVAYFNYGLTGEFTTKSDLTICLSVNHSSRDYDVEKGGLTTYWEARYGGTAFYTANIKEQLFEIENMLKYEHDLQKKVSPFVGLGYSILIPYVIEGKRILTHRSNFVEETESLGFPGKTSSYTSFGLVSNIGFSLNLVEKLKLKFGFEYKWYPDSNLKVYGYPMDEGSLNHQAIGLTFGILYKLK